MVETILEHGNHKLRDQQLHVSRLPVEEKMRTEEAMQEKEIEGGRTEAPNAILVEGLKSGTPKKMVELFFENTKRSGGGDIKHIQMNQNSGRAIVWFTDKAGKRQCNI